MSGLNEDDNGEVVREPPVESVAVAPNDNDIDYNKIPDFAEVPANNPDQPEAPKLEIVASSGFDKKVSVTEEDLFGIGLVSRELPNINAKFTTVNNKINDTKDAISLLEPIANSKQCLVCQEDARNLDKLLPGIINDDKKINYYTKDKTATLAEEFVIDAKLHISKQIEEITTNTFELIQNASSLFNAVQEKAKTDTTKTVIKQTSYLATLFEKLGPEGISSLYYINDFISFRRFINKDIIELDDLFKESTDTVLSGLINKIYRFVLDNNSLNYYVTTTSKDNDTFRLANKIVSINIESKDLEDIFITRKEVSPQNEDYKSFTFEDVSHSVTSNKYSIFINSLTGVLFKGVNRLDIFKESITQISSNPDSIDKDKLEAIIGINTMAHNLIDNLADVCTLINDIYLLGNLVVEVYKTIVERVLQE